MNDTAQPKESKPAKWKPAETWAFSRGSWTKIDDDLLLPFAEGKSYLYSRQALLDWLDEGGRR